MVKGFPIEPDAIYDDGPLVVDLGMRGSAPARGAEQWRLALHPGRPSALSRPVDSGLVEAERSTTDPREEVATC